MENEIHKSHLKKRAFYRQLEEGGGIDVELLSENHHKINLLHVRVFYNLKVLSPFCGSLLTPPLFSG